MFKFLKDKLKKSVEEVSEKIEEEGTEEVVEESTETIEETVPEKKGFFKRWFGKKKNVEEEKPSELEKVEPVEELEKTPVVEDIENVSEKEVKISESKKKGFTDVDKLLKLEDEVSKIEKQVEDIEEKSEQVEKPVEKVVEEPVEVSKPVEAVSEKIDVVKKVEEKTESVVEEKVDVKEEIAEIKNVVEDIKEDIQEQKIEEFEKEVEKPIEEEVEKTPVVEDIENVSEKEVKVSESVEEPEVEKKSELIDVKEKKKGFFSRIKEKIVTTKITEEKFDSIFWDLEVVLLENNVAIEVIEKIKEDLKKDLVNNPIKRGRVADTIAMSLKDSISSLFDLDNFDLISKIKEKKPYVICFLGVNGSGKTTSIAKVAYKLKEAGLNVVVAAGDTFRAAAIDQLEQHTEKVGVKLIKHDYGSDSAAVAFDAVKYAEQKGADVVLIDTAGRLHSNVNLMDELKKIVRVSKPDMNIFVGESITGNDCVEQAKKFNEFVPVDGIILTKADVDEKGGAFISISYVLKKPVIYFGVGQEYKDLKAFDKEFILKQLDFE